MVYNAPTTTTGTYYFRARVTDPLSDCPDPISNVVSVIVFSDAQISASVNNAEVCVGGSVTLTATPNSSFLRKQEPRTNNAFRRNAALFLT